MSKADSPTIFLDGTTADKANVMATMLAPTNAKHRRRIVNYLAMDKVVSDSAADRIAEFSLDDLRLLLSAATDTPIKPLIHLGNKRGVVAGDILANIFLMDRFDVDEPSMNKSLHVMQQFAWTAKYSDGSVVPHTEKSLRDCWRAFQSVSHFWAAKRIMQGMRATKKLPIFSDDGLPIFLSLSLAIREFATTFVPKRARPQAPLIGDHVMWKLSPEMSQDYFPELEKPHRLIKVLKNYEA